MKFTIDWLFDHLETDEPLEKITEALTSHGIEVEDVCDMSKKLDGIIVGEIVSYKKHPNADKLSVCDVNIGGGETLNIVCGAPNVVEKMKVAVALVGSVIPLSGSVIKKGSIRGVESEGMLCSSSELCFVTEIFGKNDGIISLPENFVVGKPIADVLFMNDIVIEVTITPNRGDCMSVRGIGRLLADAGIGSLKPLMVNKFEENEGSDELVDIETKDCLYFSTKIIEGYNHNLRTPDFISRRLTAVGQKLIHPPVDIANYICFDIGQPLHIFDFDKIPGHKLIVRNSVGGEVLDTLDGNKTNIAEGSVVVANSVGDPMSIAGIMGGCPSSFTNKTTNILIESAYFDKIAISLAGQKMRLHSDSRLRNERGTDPEMVDVAINYAASLIGGGKIYKTKKFGNLPKNTKNITVTFEKFKNITGLKRWDYDGDTVNFVSQSYRHDLEIEEDIIEEMLISYGYDNITAEELSKVEPILDEYTEDRVSDILCDNGYFEVKTFSFVDDITANFFENSEKIIKITNPLSTDFAVMRPSVIVSLLKNVKNNQNKSQENCRFFEVGRKFSLEDRNIKEENMLTMIITGKNTEKNWRIKSEDVSVFDIKKDIERVLSGLGLSRFKVLGNGFEKRRYYHPGRSGVYTFKKDETLCYFGEIHPGVLKKMDINIPVIAAEIFLGEFPEKIIEKAKKHIVLSQFQPIIRDFSFIVNMDLEVSKVVDSINEIKSEYIQNINIFDVYNMTDSEKAVGVEIVLQSSTNTLTEKDINDVSGEIITIVQKKCNAKLRD
ncbi:MAG: phenylalanine--tRNA ligase subunit beta [Holosporales bacterium]|jgi:phenylalanyl-tRNA synthetase beta chain|nr:phenylalanine--tRNA ligase subunit beta [Holosporales bacterium]